MSRYARQELLPAVGHFGQARLANAHAAIVGLGALGCAAADLLARAGVGRLSLIDRDTVDLTNLQRQSLFDESDAAHGRPKALAAARRLAAVNASIALRPVVAHLDHRSASRLLGSPSVILDGTDNFPTRFLLNDLAIRDRVPLVYAGVLGTRGLTMPIAPDGPCLRCAFEHPPDPGTQPTCDTAGVLGPAVAAIAAFQAAAALRFLLADPPEPALTDLDAYTARVRRVPVPRRPDCPCCAHRRFDFLNPDAHADAALLCGRSSVQITPPAPRDLDLAALAQRLAPLGSFRLVEGVLLRGTIDPAPPTTAATILTIFADGRAIIDGTSSPDAARALYDRALG